MKSITILIPTFNESGNLLRLHEKLSETLAALPSFRFRILFVDDGSKDDTVTTLEELAKKDARIQVIVLTRNFGKEIALTAGIQHLPTETDAVVIMDADLQHPPELIPVFIQEWEEGFEVVSTRRVSAKKQPFLKRVGSHVFYSLFNSISDMKMISQTTDFRLLDRVVIDSLRQFTERNRIVRGIIDWMGYKTTVVDFEAPERFSGEAGYSYLKLLRLAINSFTAFSLFPLKVTGYLGILLMTLFGSGFLYMVFDKLFLHFGNFTPLAFVVMINSFLFGLVLSSLGLIALYIGNIHDEVVNRPLYLVRKTISGKRKGTQRRKMR